MSYIEEFLALLQNRDLSRFLQLWEEYCSNDRADGKEFRQLLELLKDSDLAGPMGKYVETALPLWSLIEDKKLSHEVLRLIVDIQTSNSELLADTALRFLKEHYSDQKYYNEKIRLVGLRHRQDFQGAIRNYELLTHMDVGKFVFHTGGWGAGEIISLSLVREELVVEFEHVGGKKILSFANAFHTLKALPDDHFLSRRFGNPDKLEEEARQDPAAVVKLLLKDLGPKTASEIKDELCGLVIPEEDWSHWWQTARSKVKKDTEVASPSTVRDPFFLRDEVLTHEERFLEELKKKGSFFEILHDSYNLVRELPNVLKNTQFVSTVQQKIRDFLQQGLSEENAVQALMFLEMLSRSTKSEELRQFVRELTDPFSIVEKVDILAFKKRLLVEMKAVRSDWIDIYLYLFFALSQSTLKEHMLRELEGDERGKILIEEKIEELRNQPSQNPEVVVWYFTRILAPQEHPTAETVVARQRWFEAFLTLYSLIDAQPQYRELVKKMYNMLSAKRYALVRFLLQEASEEQVREYLLLISKCQSLGDHDKKIFGSLAEVAHPSLSTSSKKAPEENAIWTTEESYLKTQERIRRLSTVEVVENAKEIEAARALGDLRENSEYKFALERRSRLQAEIKQLSDQIHRARVLTPQDIITSEVSVGTIVSLTNKKQEPTTYTILGPWDANPDKGILSFQSKLAQAMLAHRVGDTFQFKGEEFKIQEIKSYLE